MPLPELLCLASRGGCRALAYDFKYTQRQEVLGGRQRPASAGLVRRGAFRCVEHGTTVARAVDASASHDRRDSPRVPDVGKRIGVEEDEIRDLARFDRAEGIERVQISGRLVCRRTQRTHRREPRLNEVRELVVKPEPRDAIAQRVA